MIGSLLLVLALAPVFQSALPNDLTEVPGLWTAGAQDWGPNEARIATLTEGVAEGKSAIGLNYSQGYEHYVVFPKWRNAGWDLSDRDSIEFKLKVPQESRWHGPNPTIYLRSRSGPFVRIRPAGRASKIVAGSGGWNQVSVPLKANPDWESFSWLGGTLKKVDFIEIAFTGGTEAGAAHCIMVDDVRFGGRPLIYTPPNDQAGDLDVLLIERAPLYRRYVLPEYDASREIGKESDSVQHQPNPGERVTFTATVQNKGRSPLGGTYAWILDGTEVSQGSIEPLEPRAKATFSHVWAWLPGDHDLSFRLKPSGEDYCGANDSLTVRTNALLLKFSVERGLIARMESKVNMMGSYSLEDWLQGQLGFMNQLFESSVYPFAPKGIEQRVAVGCIEYVDDGYLPSLGGGPYRVGELDPRLDGGRGLTALDDPWNSGAGAPSFLNFIGRPDDAWLHELSHQIGVIDDYQLITEPEDNQVNGVGFSYRERGLMGGGDISPHQSTGQLYSLYSPSNVQGLNATKGKRRGFFGEYLFCMPQTCRVRLLDEQGEPVRQAAVRAYQTLDRRIDTVPEHVGKTDSSGIWSLPNRPIPGGPLTTATGCTLHDNPFGFVHVVGFNGVMLLVADCADGKTRYGFITVQEFNVEHAAGRTKSATIEVRTQVKGDEKWAYGRL